MDNRRFDDLTRTLVTTGTRRTTLRALAGGMLAAGLARLRLEEAAAACKKTGKKCDKNKDCCSKKCKNGKCRCRKNGTTCAASNQCCSSFCQTQEPSEGPTCCVPNDKTCGQDSDCCQNEENPAACENDRCCNLAGRPCAVPGPFQTGTCCAGLVCDLDTLECVELGLKDPSSA